MIGSLFSVFISSVYLFIYLFIYFLVCLIPRAFKLEACLKCTWIKAVHWFWRGGGAANCVQHRSNVMQAADELAVTRKGISRIAVMMDQNKEKKTFWDDGHEWSMAREFTHQVKSTSHGSKQ